MYIYIYMYVYIYIYIYTHSELEESAEDGARGRTRRAGLHKDRISIKTANEYSEFP